MKDANQVSKWWNDKANKKNSKIFDNISGYEKMVLIYILYNKGNWQEPSGKKNT